MALPIEPSVKKKADEIIAICDAAILLNQPNPSDPAPIAANKVEELAAWNLYRNQALGFYAL